MAQVPLDLRLSLREGSVYYFRERTVGSAEPHFQIVINDPLQQEVLLLAIVTSKVDKVKQRRRDAPETLLELGPSDLSGILTRASIVDCNRLIRVSLEEFCQSWARKEIATFDRDLPPRLRAALRRAIHASKLVPDEIKSLVAAP